MDIKNEIDAYFKSLNVKFEWDKNVIRLLDFNYSFLVISEICSYTPQDFNLKRVKEKNDHQNLLIFIWFDLWETKPNVIKSKICHLVNQSQKIHARQTIFRALDKNEALDFLNQNHLLNPQNGSYFYGLFHKNKLVSAAVFGKIRTFRDQTLSSELIMFSTLNFIHINGGLSKILSGYHKAHPSHNIMTYIDIDWSDGERFNKIGFKHKSTTKPQYFKPINLSTKSRQIVENNNDINLVFNMGSLKYILTFGSQNWKTKQ